MITWSLGAIVENRYFPLKPGKLSFPTWRGETLMSIHSSMLPRKIWCKSSKASGILAVESSTENQQNWISIERVHEWLTYFLEPKIGVFHWLSFGYNIPDAFDINSSLLMTNRKNQSLECTAIGQSEEFHWHYNWWLRAGKWSNWVSFWHLNETESGVTMTWGVIGSNCF